MSNFHKYCAWPVLCPRCAEITIANFRKKPLSCLECASTDVVKMTDKSTWKGDGVASLMAWDLTLTDGHYRCPKCNKFDLHFEDGGMQWD